MPRTRSSHQTRDRAARIYREVRDLIVTGRLPPGTRLVEKDIAERFHASRTPVRSALDRLEHEGYVVNTPGLKHSLSQVAPLTRRDAVDLFDTLAALEGVAARHAASMPPARRKPIVAEMRRLNAELRVESRKRQPVHQTLQRLDAAFHSQYIDAGAGPRLRALLGTIRPQAVRYDQLYVVLLAHRMQPSLAEHQAVIRAIERGNADAAARAAEANQRNAGQRLSRAIDTMGERGSW